MANQTLDILKKRSSTRFYTDEKLTDEELKILIEAGLQAPTARNSKELFFTVVQGDNEILDEIDTETWKLRGQEKQAQNFYYNAPAVILISSTENVGWEEVDAGIAVENIAIAAESIDLGNLIIGCIRAALTGENKEYYSKKLEIPEGYTFQVAIAVGHKDKEKEPHTYTWSEQVKYV